MDCVICKNGKTNPGYSTFTLDKDNSVVVFKEVPAHICENCGHAYFDEHISTELFLMAQETIDKGVEVEVRTLKHAS